MAEHTDTLGLLRKLEGELAEQFASNRRVMSFDDYFATLTRDPARALRSSAQYLTDCIEHFGRETVNGAIGEVPRLKVFDAEFEEGRGRLIGQERAQAEFYRILTNFVSERRVTRLVLLHGPNGSAKSSFIRCLERSLEAYSQHDDGAIYTFNWVFPKSSVSKKRLGFGGKSVDRPEALTSFALLDEEDVSAVLPSDLRDHPLLLLPRDERRAILETLMETGALSADYPIADVVWDGDLSPRSRAIFDALLAAYHGDYQRVFQHIQVERFYFSQRYRRGLVTIEPQLHVDASIRQVTMDQGLQSLPPALRHLNLFEPQGDLVDANRGLIEFNDLLKKPIDAYKYLLATCEKGTVTLPNAILHLDVLFMASSNDTHLSAFKQYADFPSFKGRIDLVKMPYLRDYRVEEQIYDMALEEHGGDIDADPYATSVLALWGVLTRLRRPNPENYPEKARDIVKGLTPLDKAELYAGVHEAKDLSGDQRRLLRALVPELLAEGQNEDAYEGGSGASPRVLKQVLLNALQNPNHHGLSALAIFDELRVLVGMRTIYDFLKAEPGGGYYDHAGFVEQVFDRYLDKLNGDVQIAMGLVTEGQYEELFSRYILHVSYGLKGERIYNATTGKSEDPDQRLIAQLEGTWKVEDAEAHRRDLIARVGAWRVDHPDVAIHYRGLFPELFTALERDYYERQRDTVRTVSQHMLAVLASEQEDGPADNLEPDDRAEALKAIDRMVADKGYPRKGLRDPLAALLKQRYS